jgi:hypothetical protein
MFYCQYDKDASAMSARQHVAFLIGRVMLGGMYLYSGITNVSENPQVQFVGVGAQSGKVLQGVFIGDYTAVALGSDLVFHPCWIDFRGKLGTTLPNQDIYTQAIVLK